MSRILLVDDEPMTTRALQTLLLNEIEDVEVYCADSATEAMDWLDRSLFDVVVTDVSMPRVSGLELLDRIKQSWPSCYVIVLTAYDSFDYAYRTAQYEDVRFVLKIEPPSVIVDAVRGGLKKVGQYFAMTRDNRRLRSYLQDALPLVRQTLLDKLLRYGEDLPDAAICEKCGIGVLPGRDTTLAVTGPVTEKQEICFQVLSIFRDSGLKAEAWYGDNGLAFLIQSDGDGDRLPFIRSRLDRVIEGTDAAAGLSFVLSDRPIPWDHLAEGMTVLDAYARRALESDRIVLLSPSPEGKRSIEFGDLLLWRRFIEKRDADAIVGALGACLTREGFAQERFGAALLLHMLLRENFGADCLDGVRIGEYSARSLLFHGGFDEPGDWLQAVRRLLDALFSGRSLQTLSETDGVLDRVNRYIEAHFREPITLTGIAEHFNYNSSYLSRIYKRNMREGLIEHVIRVRIETACRMLDMSAESVSGIAEQCGFQTTKYFITVFKRLKGTTPKGWRERANRADDCQSM